MRTQPTVKFSCIARASVTAAACLQWTRLLVIYHVCCFRHVASDDVFVFNMKNMCGETADLGFASHPVGRLEYYNDVIQDVTSDAFRDVNAKGEKRDACMVVVEPGILKDRIGFHVLGISSEYCGPASLAPPGEYRTDGDTDLVVTVRGTANKEGVAIALQFTLYNEKDLRATCDRYTCPVGECVPQMTCRFSYSPCDLHACNVDEGGDSNLGSTQKLSHLQVYGIVFGILIGLSLCMCRFAVKSSDIKDDILNRVNSFHRFSLVVVYVTVSDVFWSLEMSLMNGGQASRIEEPDCRDANRYHSFVIEDLVQQNNHASRQGSPVHDLRRQDSDPQPDSRVASLRETSRFLSGSDETPPSFSAIVECNFHYMESSPRSPRHIEHSPCCSRHCSRSASRNNSPLRASRSDSRQGSRNSSRHASCSGSRHASRSNSRHASRNNSPVPIILTSDTLPPTSYTDYVDHYQLASRRSLYNNYIVNADLPPSFSSVVDENTSSRYGSSDNAWPKSSDFFAGNSSLRRGHNETEIIPLRTLSPEEIGPTTQPPSYEEVISNEEKYNIQPV